MKRINEWIIETVTGRRYIMGSYRKVKTALKPLRLAIMFSAMLAIAYAVGFLVYEMASRFDLP